MGEIKSTLDIIMERTRGLRMTEKERKAFKEQEAAGKIKGFIQKYLDGMIDLKRFQEQVGVLKNEVKDDRVVAHLFEEECLDRMDLVEDNERLFEILEKAADLDVPALKQKLKEVATQVNRERDVREDRLATGLRKRGISGTAVLTNIHADPGWNEYLGKMKQALKETLRVSGHEIQGKR